MGLVKGKGSPGGETRCAREDGEDREAGEEPGCAWEGEVPPEVEESQRQRHLNGDARRLEMIEIWSSPESLSWRQNFEIIDSDSLDDC